MLCACYTFHSPTLHRRFFQFNAIVAFPLLPCERVCVCVCEVALTCATLLLCYVWRFFILLRVFDFFFLFTSFQFRHRCKILLHPYTLRVAVYLIACMGAIFCKHRIQSHIIYGVWPTMLELKLYISFIHILLLWLCDFGCILIAMSLSLWTFCRLSRSFECIWSRTQWAWLHCFRSSQFHLLVIHWSRRMTRYVMCTIKISFKFDGQHGTVGFLFHAEMFHFVPLLQ